MKIPSLSLTALAVSPFLAAGSDHDHGECTHGILYVSDKDSSTVRGYDLDGDLSNLAEVATITGLQGDGALAMDTTPSGLYVVATYWGSEETGWQDGVVNFINTGTELHDDHMDTGTPSVLPKAQLDCSPVWHFAGHAGQISLYCDGSMAKKVNSSFYILDESLLGEGVNPYLFNNSLVGSHHGIAIPLSTTRVLHSLALDERIRGDENASSLPDHFQVVDPEGNVMHELTNSSDPSSHCTEYHGGSVVDNTVYMCCADKVLVIKFDPNADTITTRTINFPSTISDAHRCGSIYTSSKSKYVVSDYADWDDYVPHLAAFPKDATDLTDSDVLVLGETGQCEFKFEHAEGEYLVVLLSTGVVEFYSYARPDGWELEASTTIEGITDCENATLVVGYMQAFVSVHATKTIYAIDMSHIDHGEGVEVSSTVLDFSPNDMTVGAVPSGFGCDGHEEHDNEGEGDNGAATKAPSSAAFRQALVPVMLMAAAFGIVS